MTIFAIESSCDDNAAAVVENGRKVLSSVVASQVFRHVEFGGVVPEIAGRMHCEAISGVVKEALAQARTDIRDVLHESFLARRQQQRRQRPEQNLSVHSL